MLPFHDVESAIVEQDTDLYVKCRLEDVAARKPLVFGHQTKTSLQSATRKFSRSPIVVSGIVDFMDDRYPSINLN
jgi:hypothetical protein